MKTALLRAATSRKQGFREWDGLKLGHDTGKVWFGASTCVPQLSGLWFMWKFHEHRGGMGGRDVKHFKGEIRERVFSLIRQQGTQARF